VNSAERSFLLPGAVDPSRTFKTLALIKDKGLSVVRKRPEFAYLG